MQWTGLWLEFTSKSLIIIWWRTVELAHIIRRRSLILCLSTRTSQAYKFFIYYDPSEHKFVYSTARTHVCFNLEPLKIITHAALLLSKNDLLCFFMFFYLFVFVLEWENVTSFRMFRERLKVTFPSFLQDDKMECSNNWKTKNNLKMECFERSGNTMLAKHSSSIAEQTSLFRSFQSSLNVNISSIRISSLYYREHMLWYLLVIR